MPEDSATSAAVGDTTQNENPSVASSPEAVQPKANVAPVAEQMPATPPAQESQVSTVAAVPESVSVLQEDEVAQPDTSTLSDEEKKEKLKEYQTTLKSLFKEQDFKQIYITLEALKPYDPEGKISQKWLQKAQKLEAQSTKKANQQAIKELEKSIKEAFTSQSPEQVEDIAKQLDALDPGNRLALKYMKKMGKEDQLTAVEKPGLLARLLSLFKPKKQVEGNVFTNVFNKDPQAGDQSIVETIIKEKTAQEQKSNAFSGISSSQAAPKKKGFMWVKFSRLFFHLSLSFTVITAGFLYLQVVDKDNQILGLFGVKNQAIQLAQIEGRLDRVKDQEASLQDQIDLYKAGNDDPNQEVIDQIIQNRLDWQEVVEKVNEVINQIYALNDFFENIKTNDFSFNTETLEISLTGTLSDPLGENLKKMVELEEAFIHYPGDPNDPNNNMQPYFVDFKPLTNFVKTFDGEQYVSNFRLSFKLNQGDPEQ